jgi:hypothetical protein
MRGARAASSTASQAPSRLQLASVGTPAPAHLDRDLEEALLAIEDLLARRLEALEVDFDAAGENVSLHLHRAAVDGQLLGGVGVGVKDLEGERARGGRGVRV